MIRKIRGPIGARRGIALVSVLLIMAVVLILAFTFSFVAVSERRAMASSAVVDTSVQVADAVSERARLEVMATYDQSNYSTGNFLASLRKQLDTGVVTFPSLEGVTELKVDALEAGWQVHDVFADASSRSGWIDVAATVATPRGTQTVIRSIGFGVPPIFELALLSETTNCMYCHLRVNGDVGSLEFFRPGWGLEGSSGQNTGAGSVVHGTVYAAKAISSDKAQLQGAVKTVNGADIEGDLEANSGSPKLPSDTDNDGAIDWPAIERESARLNADGSLGVNASASDGARMIGVPLGGSAATVLNGNLSSVDRVYNGNLILVGTEANPIRLEDSVFVEGDVIIQGVVTGTGTLYAGRNVYIAGDLTTLEPPDKLGEPGACAQIPPNAADAADRCAKANILAGKDTLNIGARGSVVIGDYTEYRADGEFMPWSQRQASDFYRRQFGFGLYEAGVNESFDKAYDKANGDELSFVDPDGDGQGDYVNVDGEKIGNSCGGQVVCRTATAGLAQSAAGQDAYSYSFRPGRVTASGGFASWLSDEQYRNLLGSETYSYNTWRWDIPAYSTEPTQAAKLSRLKADLKRALEGDPSRPTGLTMTDASLDALLSGSSLDIVDTLLGKVGEFERRPEPGLGDLRAVIAADASWETQVNRVDAFLYANQRIAGKVSGQAMAVQGGLIGKKIGVLAPGRRLEFSTYAADIDPKTACDGPATNPYFVEGSEDCSLTINYDYRMRNGGWGFDILDAEIGKTVAWRLAETRDERVTW